MRQKLRLISATVQKTSEFVEWDWVPWDAFEVGCNMVYSGLWKKLVTVDGWVDTGMEVTLKTKLCLERLWFLFVSSQLTKGLPCVHWSVDDVWAVYTFGLVSSVA